MFAGLKSSISTCLEIYLLGGTRAGRDRGATCRASLPERHGCYLTTISPFAIEMDEQTVLSVRGKLLLVEC